MPEGLHDINIHVINLNTGKNITLTPNPSSSWHELSSEVAGQQKPLQKCFNVTVAFNAATC